MGLQIVGTDTDSEFLRVAEVRVIITTLDTQLVVL